MVSWITEWREDQNNNDQSRGTSYPQWETPVSGESPRRRERARDEDLDAGACDHRRAGDSPSRRPVYPPNRYRPNTARRSSQGPRPPEVLRRRCPSQDNGALRERPFTERQPRSCPAIPFLSRRTRTLFSAPSGQPRPPWAFRVALLDARWCHARGLRGRAMLSTSLAARLAFISALVALGETSPWILPVVPPRPFSRAVGMEEDRGDRRKGERLAHVRRRNFLGGV